MNISFLEKTDLQSKIPALKKIWLSSFSDTPSYVDRFIKVRLPDALPCVAMSNGIPVGAAYLLPCKTGERCAYYLYALSVLPDFRGLGVGRRILSHVFSFIENENSLCFLSPASPSLVEYYQEAGMHPSHLAKYVSYAPTPYDVPLCPLTPEVVLAHSADKAIIWGQKHIRYAIQEAMAGDGFALATATGTAGAIGRREKDRLLVTDLFAEDPLPLLSALCHRFSVTEVSLRVPSVSLDSEAFVLTMSYPTKILQSGEISLLLD